MCYPSFRFVFCLLLWLLPLAGTAQLMLPQQVPHEGVWAVSITLQDTAGNLVDMPRLCEARVWFADNKMGIAAGDFCNTPTFLSMERLGPHMAMQGAIFTVERSLNGKQWVFVNHSSEGCITYIFTAKQPQQ